MTVKQAAKILNRSPEQVRRLCRAGIIKATMPGRDWIIDAESLNSDRVKNRPKPGPVLRRKQTQEQTT